MRDKEKHEQEKGKKKDLLSFSIHEIERMRKLEEAQMQLLEAGVSLELRA